MRLQKSVACIIDTRGGRHNPASPANPPLPTRDARRSPSVRPPAVPTEIHLSPWRGRWGRRPGDDPHSCDSLTHTRASRTPFWRRTGCDSVGTRSRNSGVNSDSQGKYRPANTGACLARALCEQPRKCQEFRTRHEFGPEKISGLSSPVSRPIFVPRPCYLVAESSGRSLQLATANPTTLT